MRSRRRPTPGMRPPRLRSAALLALLASLAAASACGLNPPSGVRVDRRVAGAIEEEPDVRRLPPAARPGESPEQVVRGFLGAAAAAPDSDRELARTFLLPGVHWDGDAGTTVYDPTTLTLRPVPVPGNGDVAFRLRAERLATVARDGGYLPAKGRVDLVVRLSRVGRDWRIRNPPPGLLLTPRDLTRGYRPVVRYLLAPHADVLVPDPVYLTGTRSTIAGAAVRALFAGPSDWLAPAVRTEVPPDLTPLGSVVVTDGVAVVDLDRAAFDVPAEVRPLLVGQLTATMSTVPGVDQVRVLAEGRPYQEGDSVGAAVAPPELRPVLDGPTYALAPDGTLLRVQTAEPGEPPAGISTVPGAPPALTSAVPDPDGGGDLAALQFTGRGARLLIGPLGHLVPARLQAAPLVAPSWLPGEGVVVADGSRLLLVTLDGTVQDLATPMLGLLGVPREVAVSPDGTRLLLRTGPADPDRSGHGESDELWLARIVDRNGKPYAEGWTQLYTGVDAVGQPSWESGTQVVLTGRRSGSPRGLWRVSIARLTDPEPITSAGLPAPPTGVSAATGRSLYVVAAGQLWRLDGDRWTALGPARSVAQPH